MVQRRYPWIAQQNWHDILFIHSPVPEQYLRKFVPEPFIIDTYEGQSWMSIVLFKATKSRPRFMPEWFSYPLFHQMNIRTYVRFGNERGVYFFSINTDSPLVAKGGHAVSLPFRRAPMTIQQESDRFLFTGEQLPPGQKGRFQVAYQPHAEGCFTPDVASLSYFLTERYCIWMIRGNRLVKAPINHAPWHLQQANTSIVERRNFDFPFTHDTCSHYAAHQHSVIYPFEHIGVISR